jgi:hypothetical protein
MKTLIQSIACAAALVSVSAFAGTPPAQNHQCMKDGVVLEKTKKQCAKEGGKWEKMAAAKPAPKAEPKPAEPKADDAAAAPKAE